MEREGTVITDASEAAAADHYNSTLLDRRDLTAELAIVTVRPDSGTVAEFVPGQYTLLGLPPDDGPAFTPGGRPRLVKRAYSISSAAQQRDHYEFYVVLVEGGKLSTRLWTINTGDRLWMDDSVRGGFTLAHAGRDADVLMVATGTGIAPFMSMLRTYRETPPWRRCILVHGVRRVADLGYRDELEALAFSDPSFVYVPTVSREPWPGLSGRVQSVVEPEAFVAATGLELAPHDFHVFLCGNPEMVEGTRAQLAARGFAEGQVDGPGGIHFEKYW
jgi:ferredoxin--NADP+ reductase